MSDGERYDLAVRGGTLVRPDGRAELDIYVADGKVTAKERGRLHRMQDRASRNIHHQKHDAQVAAKP